MNQFSILDVAASCGLTFKQRHNTLYCQEHDSLTISLKKGQWVYYWGSLGHGGGLKKFKKALACKGYQVGNYTPNTNQKYDFRPYSEIKPKYTPAEYVKFATNSLGKLDSNFHSASRKLGINNAELLKSNVGTYKGQTVFVTKNIYGKAIAMKNVNYAENGKRITGESKKFIKKEAELGCFGEHDFNPKKRSGVVESEKSRVWLQAKYPEYNWLATGGTSGEANFLAAKNRINEYLGYEYNEYFYVADNDKPSFDFGIKLGLAMFFVPSKIKGYDLADYVADVKGLVNPNLFEVLETYIPNRKNKYDGHQTVYQLSYERKYLTDENRENKRIEAILRKHGQIAVKAYTGAGKTELAYYLAKQLGLNLILVVPYRALASQIESRFEQMVGYIGGDSAEKLHKAKNAQFVTTTYDSVSSLLKDNEHFTSENTLFVADEYHNFVNQYGFRSKAINAVLKIFKTFKNSILLSATPIEQLCAVECIQMVDVQTTTERLNMNILEFSKTREFEKIIYGIAQNKLKNGIVAIRLNDKKELDKVAKYLVSIGIAKANEVAKIWNSDDLDHDVCEIDGKLITNLQYIIDNQEVTSTIKIILCTAKLTDGSQIFNSNVGTICTVFSRQDTANSSDAIQFPKRFRNANKADIFVVMPKKEDLGIDIQGFIDLQKKDLLSCKAFAKKVNNETDISGLDEINFNFKKGTFSGKLNKNSEYDSLQALFHVRKKHNQRLCKRSLEAEIKDIAPYFTFEPIELGSNENVDFGRLADIKQNDKEHSKYKKEISLRACEDDLYQIANVCEGLVKEKDKQKEIAKFLKSEQKRNGVDRLDTAVQDFVKPFLSSILVILLDFIKVHNFLKGLASKEQVFKIINNQRFKHFFQTVKFHTIMYCMNEGIKPKWKVNKEDMFWARLMTETYDRLLEHHYQKELTATELYRVVGCKDLDFRNLNKFVTILSNGEITQSKSNGITKYHINLSGGIEEVLGSFDLHMGVTQGHQIDIFDFGNCEIDCPF